MARRAPSKYPVSPSRPPPPHDWLPALSTRFSTDGWIPEWNEISCLCRVVVFVLVFSFLFRIPLQLWCAVHRRWNEVICLFSSFTSCKACTKSLKDPLFNTTNHHQRKTIHHYLPPKWSCFWSLLHLLSALLASWCIHHMVSKTKTMIMIMISCWRNKQRTFQGVIRGF